MSKLDDKDLTNVAAGAHGAHVEQPEGTPGVNPRTGGSGDTGDGGGIDSTVESENSGGGGTSNEGLV